MRTFRHRRASCLRTGRSEYSACLACFSANLREWRVAQGRKLADVAREFGVATSTWGHWETGVCLPTGENLCLLAEFARVSLQHLVCPNASRCPYARRGKGARMWRRGRAGR